MQEGRDFYGTLSSKCDKNYLVTSTQLLEFLQI